jgi:biopolymer transport protein ExbB/TolQ
MYQPIPYKIFLHWLLGSSLILFALLLLLDQGVLPHIVSQDVTRISLVILILFIGTCCHCGYRAWHLSVQSLHFDELLQNPSAFKAQHPQRPHSLISTYLQSLTREDSQPTLSAEVLAERLSGAHQTGWFITGILVKLGLLGTVVGFVLMLESVNGLENLDTSDLKNLMQQMTQGMGVAMNTTLVGLVCSMVLGAQYLMLDRGADQLLAQTLEEGQKRLDDEAAEKADTEHKSEKA